MRSKMTRSALEPSVAAFVPSRQASKKRQESTPFFAVALQLTRTVVLRIDRATSSPAHEKSRWRANTLRASLGLAPLRQRLGPHV